MLTKRLEMEVENQDSTGEALKADTIQHETVSEELLLAKTLKDLRKIAFGRKIGRGGTKVELITRIMANVKEAPTRVDKGILEEALMKWQQSVQKGYLARLNKPVSGTKTVLAQRIMTCISIEEAVKVVQEYRTWLDTKATSEDMDVDENEVMGGEEMTMKEGEIGEGKKRNTIDEDKLQKRVDKRLRDKKRSLDSSFAEVDEGTKERNSGETLGESSEDDGADEAGYKMVGDDNSVETSKNSNICRTRIGLMLTAPPSTNEPDKKLALQAQKWFKKMQEVDTHFALVPWKAVDSAKPNIKEMEKIPSMMSQLRVYLTRAQAKTKGGAVYVDVYVQHSVPMDDLKGDSEWFLKEHKMGIFLKTLQVEATSQMGWLLYSTNTLDIKCLSEVLTDECRGIQIALRFKYINTDKYEPDKDERKKWMAIHIEVDKTVEKQAARRLSKIYGSSAIAFPLGIRMRLVSEFREVKGNPVMMGKHMRLRLRQSQFNHFTVGHPNDDIMLLDYESEGNTLRGLIMAIPSGDKKTPGNLFHAIGMDWKGRYTFNFLKNKKEEATMIADGIIPFLVHLHGNTVLQFFDPEAVREKSEWQWDPKKRTIINPLSRELDELEGADDDYDFSVAFNEETKNDPTVDVQDEDGMLSGNMTAQEMALSKMNLVLTGQDTDSVSTLGNPLSPRRLQKKGASLIANQSPAGGIAQIPTPSVVSAMSSRTMESRVSQMEQQLSEMETNINNNMKATLESLFLKFGAGVQTTQPPGGASAGGSNG